MHLHFAKTLFVQDQLNWNRPHLNWVAKKLYGFGRKRR